MLEFKNVSKTYANGVQANKNISFTVSRGQSVGIVGPNGCGKTTLLRQLFGILKISSGEILIDNKQNYMELLSYVPQFPAVYPGLTVLETIYVTLRYQGLNKYKAKEVAGKVAKETNIESISNRFVYSLSGGQQKLLAFACAISQQKPYVILDEVTSMVDIVTKEIIWDLIQKEKENKGILLASHDMSEVKRLCDYIIVLKDGEIIFSGRPDQVKNTYCKATVKTSDNNKVINYLKSKNNEFEIINENLCITTDTIMYLLEIINEISDFVEIINFSCEHPAFYEGVISIVRNHKN